MKVASTFTISLHILMCMEIYKDKKITSEFLAASVRTNPVIIRNILSKLKKANIISVKRGVGGAHINKNLDEITLYDIYTALGLRDEIIFDFHKNPNEKCPVGKNIKRCLLPRLAKVEKSIEKELSQVTLNDIREDLKSYIK